MSILDLTLILSIENRTEPNSMLHLSLWFALPLLLHVHLLPWRASLGMSHFCAMHIPGKFLLKLHEMHLKFKFVRLLLLPWNAPVLTLHCHDLRTVCPTDFQLGLLLSCSVAWSCHVCHDFFATSLPTDPLIPHSFLIKQVGRNQKTFPSLPETFFTLISILVQMGIPKVQELSL